MRVVLLNLSQKLWEDFMMFLGPIVIMPVLSLFNWRKLGFIHVLISVKQLVRVE